ncbi:anoctamin-5-like [Hyposmocoma kahamanoa]|uniref:anoctamin-5-like n=1 Tax=Hyposmocoma kahamanoa TaxID=1477025 RepID=UPI000E6D72D7|nr:anoctamin-5-like [Hyposmocoma kahamanoa]
MARVTTRLMQLPYAPPRKKHVRYRQDEQENDEEGETADQSSQKRPGTDSITYKAKLEGILAQPPGKKHKEENKQIEKAQNKMRMKLYSQEMKEKQMEEVKKELAEKEAKRKAKRLAKLGTVRKGYGTRKLYVDEIDLDDMSVYDPLQAEMGSNISKRFPKDFLQDRMTLITPSYTGMFRECCKRVDYVLAFSDEGDDLYVDELKSNFLSTLVKIGLDLEIEKGVLPEHNNLLFCKIHAPDLVLDQYKYMFEVVKYFQDNHVHWIGRQGMTPTWKDMFRNTCEREWVKLTRRRYIKPMRLSNRDRSYVTAMVVSHQPFGSRDKLYGLSRLLKAKIIVDAYALHDGPYFITNSQDLCTANARQMLFYNWAGFTNMYMSQPLTLIYEYFGSRIALYFAFYQFYITFLMFMMPIALFMIVPSWKILKSLFLKEPSNMYCKGSRMSVTGLCPSCMDFNACPIRNMSDYCEVHKLVRVTQKIMSLSPLFTMWCFLLFFFWRKKQNYWRWLWEITTKPRHPVIRPEYDVNYRTAKRHKLTGYWRVRPTVTALIHKFLIAPILCAVALIVAIGYTTFSYAYGIRIMKNHSFLMKDIIKNSSKLLSFRDYLAQFIVLPQMYIMLFIFESIFIGLSPMLTRWENHRLFKNYERSLSYRLFAYSLLFNCPALVFVFWIKGRFFRHPLDHWNSMLNISLPFYKLNFTSLFINQFMYLHCNKTINCIDEMVFTFVLIMLMYLTGVFIRSVMVFFPKILCLANTDFNISHVSQFEAPEWEREFKLKELTNDMMIKWMNSLVVQITLYVWFGNTAPWICYILFIWNIIFIRMTAKQLICCYKRPVLVNCRGLGPYNKILNFVLLSSPIAHAFSNSRMDLFWKHVFHTKNYSIVNASRIQYNLMPAKYKTDTCLYPAKYRHYYPLEELTMPWPFHWMNISSNVTQIVTTYNRYIVELNQIADIVKYTHSFIVILLLLYIHMPSKSEFVEARSFKEDEIKRYGTHEAFMILDDEPLDIMQ